MGSSGNFGKKRSVWKWIKKKVNSKRQNRKKDHKQHVRSLKTEPAESKTIQVTIEERNYTICGIDNVANVNFNVTYNNDVCKRCSRESHTNEWEKVVNLPIEESYEGLQGTCQTNLGYESSDDNEEDNICKENSKGRYSKEIDIKGPHCPLPKIPSERSNSRYVSRKLSNAIDISSDKLKDEKVMNLEPVAGMVHTSADYIHDNNIAKSLPFSTLVNDQSNIKPYSGSPELESQNETEHLMEDPTTVPKEREQSMCLQKVVENTPIPDPVPGHEETQPKLMVGDLKWTSGELKSSSYEASSGYPVQTCSSRTEIKSADMAMYSEEGDSRPSTPFSTSGPEYPSLSLTNNYKRKPTNTVLNVSYCQEHDHHISTQNVRNEVDIISKETTFELGIDSRRVDVSSNVPKMALQLYSGKSRDMVKAIVLQQLEQRYTDHIGQHVCRFVSFYVIGRSMRSIYTTWCIGTAISKLMMKSNFETGCVGDENVCNHQDKHQEEVDNRNKYTYEGSKERDAEDLFCHECLLQTDNSQSLQNRVKYHLTLPIQRLKCTPIENDNLCHDKLENTVKDNGSKVAESINIGAPKIETVHCTDDCDSGVARDNALDGSSEDMVVEETQNYPMLSLTNNYKKEPTSSSLNISCCQEQDWHTSTQNIRNEADILSRESTCKMGFDRRRVDTSRNMPQKALQLYSGKYTDMIATIHIDQRYTDHVGQCVFRFVSFNIIGRSMRSIYTTWCIGTAISKLMMNCETGLVGGENVCRHQICCELSQIHTKAELKNGLHKPTDLNHVLESKVFGISHLAVKDVAFKTRSIKDFKHETTFCQEKSGHVLAIIKGLFIIKSKCEMSIKYHDSLSNNVCVNICNTITAEEQDSVSDEDTKVDIEKSYNGTSDIHSSVNKEKNTDEVENRNKYTFEGRKVEEAKDSQSLQNRVNLSLTLPIERAEGTSLENDALCHDTLENNIKDNSIEVAESINIGATKTDTVHAHCKEECDSGVARGFDLNCLNKDMVVEETKDGTHDSFNRLEITVVENTKAQCGDKDTSSAVNANRNFSNAGGGKDPAASDALVQMFSRSTETTDNENICNTHSHTMKESEMPQNGFVEADSYTIYGSDNSINKEMELDYDSERPGQSEKSRQRGLASIGYQLKTVSSINMFGLLVKQCTKSTIDDECDDCVLPQPGERSATLDKEEYQSDILEVPQHRAVICLPELEDNRGSNSIRNKFIIKKDIDKQDIGLESLGGTKCIDGQEMLTLEPSENAKELLIPLTVIGQEIIATRQQIEKANKREIKTEYILNDFTKDNACILSNENIQSENESKPDTKVKLQKRKKRSSYFCKYCHHSREKPNDKCFRHRPHPSSRTLEKVNVQTFEDGDEAVRTELEETEPAVAYIISSYDSGVFSDFASTFSSYSQSYDSCMTNVKACCNTDKEVTDTKQISSKGLLLERLSLAERSLRDQEKKLKEILKAVTSSWSYFTPESFSPYLYPGLATYFERVQNGDQLSARERYSYEWIRFQSFDHYRGNGSGIILARNGFYHDRDAGETATRCYACDATCSDWEYFVDNAADHHRPDCPHLNRANSRNIPIQPDDGSDERVYNTAASQPGRESGTATPGAAGRDDETTTTTSAASDTSTTGAVHNNYSSRSIEQASVQLQTEGGSSAQPTQDRENEQYMSSFTAHRENTADSVATSTHTEHRSVTFTGQLTEPANLVVSNQQHCGQSLPSSCLPRNQGLGACGGTATPISQAATNRTYEPTTISQPVTVSEPGAVSQLAASGQSIASAIQDRPGLQASAQATVGPRRLETTGFVQTHPELIRIDSPRHGDYNTVDSRAASFTGTWPDTLDQTPRRMAEAGFFYTGVADFTRCFACGGGLRNWESGDDPVIEHTRWYQNCPYINRLKGEKYVKAVMLKQQQHLEERKREQQALSQQRAALPQDPLRTTVASVLVEMGYPQDRIREAIVEVRRQTGTTDVTAEQVLIWILDDDDRRNAIAARRAAGSAAFAAASATSQAVEISAPSTASSTAPQTTSTTSASSTATASSTTSQAVATSTATALKTTSTTSGSTSHQPGEARNQQSEEDQQPGSQHSSEGDSEGSEAAGNQGGATGGAEAPRSENEGSLSGRKSKRKRKKKKGQQGQQHASLPVEGATGNSGDLAPHIAPPDTQSLREENEKLRDIQTCKICLDKPVDTTFLPCGHLVCCGNCATKMRKCPICRKLIKGSVKTFMS